MPSMPDLALPWSRRLSDDDTDDSVKESDQLLNTFYINMVIFTTLIILFELVRNYKSIYLNRLTKKNIHLKRVPSPPSRFPFAWVYQVLTIPQEEVLRMIGLDGYMLLRFLILCFRLASFFSFFGVLVLVPIYHSGTAGLNGWNAFTVANIEDSSTAYALWAPVAFAYLFAIFYCQLLYYEYKNFIAKRLEYLIEGDSTTSLQTTYTIRVENLPPQLKSTPMLVDFFDRIFPNEVYSVEIALDLKELEDLTAYRKEVRDNLEKAIAHYKATGIRPTVWIARSFYGDLEEEYREMMASKVGVDQAGQAGQQQVAMLDIDQVHRSLPHMPSKLSSLASAMGYLIVDSIAHHTMLLSILNAYVAHLQAYYTQQRQQIDAIEGSKLDDLKRALKLGVVGAVGVASSLSERVRRARPGRGMGSGDGGGYDTFTQSPLVPANRDSRDVLVSKEGAAVSAPHPVTVEGTEEIKMEEEIKETDPDRPREGSGSSGTDSKKVSFEDIHADTEDTVTESRMMRKIRKGRDNGISSGKELAKRGVEGLAKEGIRTAEYATKGVLRGVLEATRALELLTIGSYYKISSTAFITFQSRVSALCASQLLLSHDYYRLSVTAAPNVYDIIWENISIPLKQINMRRVIANSILAIGAIFWSIVVAFISAVTSLESISSEIPALKRYSDTKAYIFLNYYLAIGILLILLALLPYLFDFIARSYEGIKLESEIQSTIMSRYFNYQLANIFVAVGLGSIATSLHAILDNPSSILTILGQSVASFSIYFANLLITRTFTGIPIEMLRIYNLIDIGLVTACADKKRYTRRQLRTGSFADCPMLYGWIYPNILMGLMIMVTYACIAPLLLPLCGVFFASAFAMYKYQLLYVYVNTSQAGGVMWYRLYNQSMIVLLCGVATLICYLAIRQTYMSGPFYALLPLPVCIAIVWTNTNKQFALPAKQLSLEKAKEIDRAMESERGRRQLEGFNKVLYRQPSLVEGALRPAPYRHTKRAVNTTGTVGTVGGVDSHDSGGNTPPPNEQGLLRESADTSYGTASSIFRDTIPGMEDFEEEGEEELDKEVSLFLEDVSIPLPTPTPSISVKEADIEEGRSTEGELKEGRIGGMEVDSSSGSMNSAGHSSTSRSSSARSSLVDRLSRRG